jgi:uncharacterized protein (DUF983 family)
MFFDAGEKVCPYCSDLPLEFGKLTSKLVCESCGMEN